MGAKTLIKACTATSDLGTLRLQHKFVYLTYFIVRKAGGVAYVSVTDGESDVDETGQAVVSDISFNIGSTADCQQKTIAELIRLGIL